MSLVRAFSIHREYTGTAGLNATATPADLWNQIVSGINDTAQPGDRFGLALY